MRHTEIKPNLLVVAMGEPAIVILPLPMGKVKVQLVGSREILTVDIDDLKFLPPSIGSTDDALDQCAPLPNDEEITDEVHNVAKERAFAIERYLDGGIDFKKALSIVGTKKSAFYKLIERYDKTLGASSLYPKRPGMEKNTKRIPDNVEDIITAAIEKMYKGKAASYAKVWEEVQAQCTKLKQVTPCKSTVTSRIKEVGERLLSRKKDGAEAANQKFGAKPGQLKTSYPLEKVQIDHTVVDCILVDDESREPLFRPWLTLVIDVYTRIILGYYIAFHAPSILSVACAITHAVLPKKRYLENIGCGDVNHPFCGVPEVLHMDNASEFRTIKLQRPCALHGIKAEWRPLGKKHWGGHIERLIGTMMNSHVHFLPGTTMSNVLKRGDYDSEKHAALTIEEFNRWFARQVEIYNYSVHSALKCRPSEKWNKAFAIKAAMGVHQKLITDPFKFRLDFMPEENRKIRPIGVSLFNRTYWAPELSHHIGLRNVTIKYDPFALHTIWAKIEGSYIELRFADLTRDNLSYEQHLIANKHSYRTSSKGMLENVVVARDGNEQEVRESIKKTKQSKKNSRRQKLTLSMFLINILLQVSKNLKQLQNRKLIFPKVL